MNKPKTATTEARLYQSTCNHIGVCPCEVRERMITVHVDVVPDDNGGSVLMIDESAYFTDEDAMVEWLETTDAGQEYLRTISEW